MKTKKARGPGAGQIILGGVASFGMGLAKALKAQSGAEWDKNPQWLKDWTTRPKDALGSKENPFITKAEAPKATELSKNASTPADVVKPMEEVKPLAAEVSPVTNPADGVKESVLPDMNDMDAGWKDAGPDSSSSSAMEFTPAAEPAPAIEQPTSFSS
jgi:hypothetical protein